MALPSWRLPVETSLIFSRTDDFAILGPYTYLFLFFAAFASAASMPSLSIIRIPLTDTVRVKKRF